MKDINNILVIRKYSSRSSWDDFYSRAHNSKYSEPYDGLITAEHEYDEPYPLINEVDLHCQTVMDLLYSHVYPVLKGYCKFTISLTLIKKIGYRYEDEYDEF
jgi:hypothetical protein